MSGKLSRNLSTLHKAGWWGGGGGGGRCWEVNCIGYFLSSCWQINVEPGFRELPIQDCNENVYWSSGGNSGRALGHPPPLPSLLVTTCFILLSTFAPHSEVFHPALISIYPSSSPPPPPHPINLLCEELWTITRLMSQTLNSTIDIFLLCQIPVVAGYFWSKVNFRKCKTFTRRGKNLFLAITLLITVFHLQISHAEQVWNTFRRHNQELTCCLLVLEKTQL